MASLWSRVLMKSLKAPLKARCYSVRTERSLRNIKAFDWRETSFLPEVRDQGECGGACWAFAAAAAIESALRIFRGVYVSVSRQELLDRCENLNEGGGWLHTAYDYVYRNGISYEDDYPYEEIHRYPYLKKNMVGKPRIYIDGYRKCVMNELSLAKLILQQPASVGVCAGRDYHEYRKGEIIDAYNSDRCYDVWNRSKFLVPMNHCVLLNGWGSMKKDHWISQNSWGDDWGDEGFFLLRRNKGNRWGQCDIASDCWYPIVK